MLLSPASTNGSLPSQGFWGKLKPQKNAAKDAADAQAAQQARQQHMALSRAKLLTLSYGEMETIRMLPASYAELDAAAREWAKPPPDANFALRIPIDYCSLQAARLVSGPYLYITSEEAWMIGTSGVQGTRVEIVSDAPPPPDEPPPPPVLEMPGTFNLELMPGQTIALDTTVASIDESDMAHMEDGSVVDGSFWGKLDIVHSGDSHSLTFSGTRLQSDYAPEFLVDSRVMTKLTVAARPASAKCHITILSPSQQYCDVTLSFSPLWKLAISWPPAEGVAENKVKYFLRVHAGGAMEHFESTNVVTSIYYETIPDPGSLDPHAIISPSNGYCMTFEEFVPHLTNVLEQLGMSLQARTSFISNNMNAFSQHKNIAYRFMSPQRLSAAIDIHVTTDPCIIMRIFLMFRGVADEDVGIFAGAGEKEANLHDWRSIVGWTEDSKDPSQFRLLETSILEVT